MSTTPLFDLANFIDHHNTELAEAIQRVEELETEIRTEMEDLDSRITSTVDEFFTDVRTIINNLPREEMNCQPWQILANTCSNYRELFQNMADASAASQAGY